jgi:hypothetical protein
VSFSCVGVFHKKISRQDRLGATISISVDPQYPRFCPSSNTFRIFRVDRCGQRFQSWPVKLRVHFQRSARVWRSRPWYSFRGRRHTPRLARIHRVRLGLWNSSVFVMIERPSRKHGGTWMSASDVCPLFVDEQSEGSLETYGETSRVRTWNRCFSECCSVSAATPSSSTKTQ